MGAPAQRILWMRFTQNNFFNTQAELKRKTKIILILSYFYLANYFALDNHIYMVVTQAPPFLRQRNHERFLI